MKLNVYKNQHEIEKTYETDEYDIMYGTVEDILAVFDDISDLSDNNQVLGVVKKHRSKINKLVKDIFPAMDDESLRKVKVKELVQMFIDLFAYVKNSFGTEKN